MRKTDFTKALTEYFSIYLPTTCGVSPNTTNSYRDTFKQPQNISPHVLRHTKAMHLLRAGVNMIYIRDFLGHADISTTEVYARIDAEMKRKVFEEKVPNYTPNTTMPWEEDEDLLQWLTQFGKKPF